MNYDVLIVVDMQKGLINHKAYQIETVIQNVKKLIQDARHKNIPIIYIRHDGGKGDELEQGTEGWDILEEIAPLKEDLIIDKNFNSAFRKTDLHQVLKTLYAKKLVMVGMQTEYCVDTTCKFAFEYGYQIIIPSNCTSTFDNALWHAQEIIDFYENFIWNHRYATIVDPSDIYSKKS